ncbi:hypothetical protein HanRHA438_Chr09g0423431 [Helianthus annuus]|uniref:Uncharacterized protein n=1 Tax=Helianthus annuus TaxID=4232 RepID=A0A9K3I9Z0_HELAN|nr:hypothetical protein HanXRQr2_Chr09g0411231 [Helianthus annuus]KAJ0527796.1 hypothetical protein HanHA300_Chr09g0337901 [Helianthus annuus]KAJ0544219.1 hypothetical protein HanHA89_Chr09g0359121 [Helianthus annuus]KAJ0709241.1 hypothetical protein HanLR1_Chr09g0338041 [Helianthus annuus]KAJ0713117.1 hypothetical protein HanOQP8_Chr09g0342181 [Helianthus annuus]
MAGHLLRNGELVPEELFEDTRDDPKELGKFDKATTDSYIN